MYAVRVLEESEDEEEASEEGKNKEYRMQRGTRFKSPSETSQCYHSYLIFGGIYGRF